MRTHRTILRQCTPFMNLFRLRMIRMFSRIPDSAGHPDGHPDTGTHPDVFVRSTDPRMRIRIRIRIKILRIYNKEFLTTKKRPFLFNNTHCHRNSSHSGLSLRIKSQLQDRDHGEAGPAHQAGVAVAGGSGWNAGLGEGENSTLHHARYLR